MCEIIPYFALKLEEETERSLISEAREPAPNGRATGAWNPLRPQTPRRAARPPAGHGRNRWWGKLRFGSEVKSSGQPARLRGRAAGLAEPGCHWPLGPEEVVGPRLGDLACCGGAAHARGPAWMVAQQRGPRALSWPWDDCGAFCSGSFRAGVFLRTRAELLTLCFHSVPLRHPRWK